MAIVNDIGLLYQERNTRDLTDRERAAVNFWEVCLLTDFSHSDITEFDVADMIERVLDCPTS